MLAPTLRRTRPISAVVPKLLDPEVFLGIVNTIRYIVLDDPAQATATRYKVITI